MRFDVGNPWLLLALPLTLGLTWLVYARWGRRSSLKGRVSVALHSAALVLLCLALAGTGLRWRGRNAQLVLLVDRSQSMKGATGWQEDWIREVEQSLPKRTAMAVLSFGEDTLVEQGFGGGRFGRLRQQPDRDATDYHQALSFAAELMDGDAAGQILLLTDDRENRGEARQLEAMLRAGAIRVDAAIREMDASEDAQVSRVRIPELVYEGEGFDIYVDIDSQVEKAATLQLFSGSTLLSQQDVQLQKGENRFVFKDTAQDRGLVTYRAVLVEQGGGTPSNNQMSTVARVLGLPRVLLVEGAEGEGTELEKMLSAASIPVEVSGPAGLPRTPAGGQRYDALLLANVSASDLSEAQVSSLDHFVKTLGRGLVVLGGDNSYALGGYIGSELEKMLPVDSDVRNKLDMPSLAMVMAIDHSGSMADGMGGRTRLELAKESAQQAVEQLADQDEVGVIAFDDTAKWIAPLQSMENADDVIRRIGGLQLGGGTMMYSSIEQAYDALMASDAAIKHLILLTDGQPADRGFEGLVEQMREDHITVSGVAMGAGANTGLMKTLSELGGGRFYHVDYADNIPAIFAKETQLSTQSYLQSRHFTPRYGAASPLTEPFAQGLPALDGFLATVEKPMATVALSSDDGLPVLADWQYGAGRVVAWTSDANGGWSGTFLAWQDAPAFFGGLVSHVLKGEEGKGTLSLGGEEGDAHLSFHVEGMDRADTVATVIAPDGSQQRVSMPLVQPGEFAATFPMDQEGVYAVKVEQALGGEIVNAVEGGLPRSYSAEYDITAGTNRQMVDSLLAATGGRVVNSAEELFATPLDRVRHRVDLTMPLLLAGLLLFFLDVAARRLQWEGPAENALAARRLKRAEKRAARTERTQGRTDTATPASSIDAGVAAADAAGGGGTDASSDVEKVAGQPGTASDMSAELLKRRRKK